MLQDILVYSSTNVSIPYRYGITVPQIELTTPFDVEFQFLIGTVLHVKYSRNFKLFQMFQFLIGTVLPKMEFLEGTSLQKASFQFLIGTVLLSSIFGQKYRVRLIFMITFQFLIGTVLQQYFRRLPALSFFSSQISSKSLSTSLFIIADFLEKSSFLQNPIFSSR